MTNKMTKKDYFNMLMEIPAVAENAALVDFISHEMDILVKKNTSGGKSAKEIAAMEELTNIVYNAVPANEPKRAAEIATICRPQADLTTQKMTAVLRKLVEDGKFNREMVKGSPLFTKVEG